MRIPFAPLVPLLIALWLASCGSGSATSGTEHANTVNKVTTVMLSGHISYDNVPHNSYGGLDYSATERRPVRAAVIEALDAKDKVLATGHTDTVGNYQLSVPANTQVRLRVQARSVGHGQQSWEIRVEDNTRANALYGLSGTLANSGTQNNTRDLNAGSGWDAGAYRKPRSAAPFALLDDAYTAMAVLRRADANLQLPVLRLRWSVNNKAADGDLTDGDISTTFYNDDAIYVLGDANNDTDEYDSSVIAHEYGHFVAAKVSKRDDSSGGTHGLNNKLDFRLAYSEGLADAFSGIALNNAIYKDSTGDKQSAGNTFDLSQTRVTNAGWFNEASIYSVFYHYIQQRGFTPVYKALVAPDYQNSESLISIFSFASVLNDAIFNHLLNEQAINSHNAFAEGETNNGDTLGVLPIYKKLAAYGGVLNVCSSAINGQGNMLGVWQFIRLQVPATGQYKISVVNTTASVDTNPDYYLYYKGASVSYPKGLSHTENTETSTHKLMQGNTYILVVGDALHAGSSVNYYPRSCFDVSVTPTS